MTNNNTIINHCPNCDSLCLVSQNEVNEAKAAKKVVAISCHQCDTQFGLDHTRPTGTKRGRPAKVTIVDCPSCKIAITIPEHLSDDVTVNLSCPSCNGKIQQSDQGHQPATTPTTTLEALSPAAGISNNDHIDPTDSKLAQPAKVTIVDCPSCKMAITIPRRLFDNVRNDVSCPLCDNKILQADTEYSSTTTPLETLEAQRPIPGVRREIRDTSVKLMPLYLLVLLCLAVYLYWARETGQLPIDQWLKILG